jgi:hypothetical protein
MKKHILRITFLLMATGLWAQNGAKIVTVAQAAQKTAGAKNYSIQVGIPYLGQNQNNGTDARFPWDVLYLFETFAEGSFDVSKGYFGDKILIEWTLRNNANLVTNIEVFRREYNDNGSDDFELISNLAPNATQYEDQYVEGGVLYEYKVAVKGVFSAEIKYKTFITGIGYRNPTAIVTGNVSFKGGNPVKDVTIKVNSQGSTAASRTALKIPVTGNLEIKIENKPITTATTFQAWLRPAKAYSGDTGSAIRLFRLESGINTIDVNVKLLATSNILSVNVAGSEYELQHFYPSGELDDRGNDKLVPVTDFNTNFVHFSVAMTDGNVPLLYINGRAINEAYKTEVNALLDANNEDYVGPYLALTIPTQTTTMRIGVQETKWVTTYIGGEHAAYVDEIRIWNEVKDAQKIRTDYRRYIGGNDTSLVSYVRANEGVGEFAYDLSRTGFNHNKNHARLKDVNTNSGDEVLWESGAGNSPTPDQLGVLGVTDVNGNYEITAIPYSGTGESFNLTPLFGQHQFEPNQQLVFLGQGSEVLNKIDFIDISSFNFKGIVFYDTRDVFKSFVEADGNGTDGDTQISGPGITDEGYNFYEKGTEKYPKGEYWYNKTNDRLELYAKIYAEGVNVYVDGNIVLDENNIPEVSDKNGEFDVTVPIGNHYITLKKDGHEFAYNGRFPAEPGTFKKFFEDANENVTFIDKTRVTAVGRVIGGGVQAQKVIGFGENGLFENTTTDPDGNSKTIAISSKNNIGVADITFGYAPNGSPVTKYTKFNFITNSASGEFRVSLLPLDYELLASDIRIPSSTTPTENTISILNAGSKEPIALASVEEVITPEFELEDGTILLGEPYHHVITGLNYRVDPVLKVLEQTSDATLKIGTAVVDTKDFDYLVFSQFKEYKIQLNSFERYINYDDGVVEDIVPVIDGELLITNNLELAGSRLLERDPNDLSIINYTYKAGPISISPPFTRTINIRYKDANGNDKEAEENSYRPLGILLGGKSDGSLTFVTAAPEVPDIILRDPPGSNSFASIESGESISFTSSSSITDTNGTDIETNISLGVDLSLGGGLAGPVMENEITSDVTSGISTSTSSTDGESITKTYSFSQSISTSGDPDYVGSDGDLYIGQAKNYFYGSFDKVQPSQTIPTKSENGFLTPMNTSEYLVLGSGVNQLYISKQKAVYFVEEPAETFFIYSQKQIIDALIPELQLLSTQAITQADKESDPLKKDKPEILTQEHYTQQVSLWRKIILENERSKYLVKNDRDNLKTSLINKVSDFKRTLQEALLEATLEVTNDDRLQGLLNDKNEVTNKIQSLLNANFDDNISFDSGVGEFTRSIETSVVAAKSTEYNLVINETVTGVLGYEFNGVGQTISISGFTDTDINSALSEEEQSTATISFTLKDNDPSNLLSVDVVNLFDGNGPIFSVLGGRTSCPYEGAELSYFYNNTDYNSNALTIAALPEEKREPLSFATQRVEVPMLSVEIAEISGVLDGNNAEFELILENNSVSGTDAVFSLVVDNLSNPNNALINIEPNGTLVNVPYGEKVYYSLTLGKSISDVYDYTGSNGPDGLPINDGIRIVLQSLCDGKEVSDDVRIKAYFIPTCSEVVLSAPLDNWVYNRETAYTSDGATKPLPINMVGFNTSFSSFEKMELEYRLATSPNWTRLQTYYVSSLFYDAAVLNNESNISLIASSTLAFSFDIAALQLQDGDYEIRARSSCSNTEFISEVITGSVDLHSPQKFGTPLPIDGILGAGEDLKVSFNENIFFNTAVSKIEIKGQTNQLPIDHSVSLYFEGNTNTAEINSPRITSGDFTIEFWMNNSTPQATTASIISQNEGLRVGLENGEMYFTLGNLTAQGAIATDNLFHHYTLTHTNSTGEISIYQDDVEIGGITGNGNLPFTNNSSLVIGGNTFIGNMHDLRLWNKTISLEDAYAKMFDKLIGNEANLIGYWPMDEGRGSIAKDLARFKHAIVNASWDIKPKSTSYNFADGHYLELDNVDFVQLTKEMDATVSFWMKTGDTQEATLFSNGRGDGSDIVQTNGSANKWAINMAGTGTLRLESEGDSYELTSQNMADDSWHHVTLLFNRIGSLRTYVDGALVSSNQMAAIAGFSGNKIWLGARGSEDLANNQTVDRTFTGKIDEFRLWNTLRNVEQITRDSYNEVDFESIGLLLYARMNEPDEATANGPRYYHAFSNQTVISTNANPINGPVNYSSDAPAIKPERSLIKFSVNHVINEDDMILEPVVTDWASLEGQILDITVHRMFDDANNMQQSPITWTAFIQRNDVSWFAEGYNEAIDIVKSSNEEVSFEITVLNKGGKEQPYAITNVPSWLSLSSPSGSVAPDSKVAITVTIDPELTTGEYLEDLFLQTDFGFDQKLQLQLRVLAQEPDWALNPTDFDFSMNLVGKVKIDGTFSEDSYDKIAAFVNGEVRGSVNLIYNESYEEYYVFLTVFSDNVYGEEIEFSIWDASQGKLTKASIDASPTTIFKKNEILGTLSTAVIFENTNEVQQQVSLNQGWTWISLNVNDADFSNLNQLTQGLDLNTSDLMLSHSPAQLEAYDKNESNPTKSGWSGTISANGGLSTAKMYKVRMANEQTLEIDGATVIVADWSIPIQVNWNWLPYPIEANRPTNEALAFFEASDGDVIKSQNLFAIYDPIIGWSGTLTYLEAGKGYMIKSSKDQLFEYPSYLSNSGKNENDKISQEKDVVVQENTRLVFNQYSSNMNAVVLMPNGYTELFVYDSNGVLKGMGNSQYVNNQALSFITVYGELPETLVFHIGDGFSKKATSKSFEFNSNGVLGSMAEPVRLDEEFALNSIYPNPFTRELTITVTVRESQTASIQLYTLAGQVVFTQQVEVEKGINNILIAPNVSSGTYILRAELDDQTVTGKVIKK